MPAFAAVVEGEVERQLARLPRRDIATASWREFGAVIILATLEQAPALADRIAAEHVQIVTRDPEQLARRIPQCRRHLSGRPYAGGDRRLPGWLQPRAADGAQRALCLGARRVMTL